MGFFSFKTADTKQSIPNIYSEKIPFTVYLLQPNNLPPIKETAYEGYGRFGGVDSYMWLAEQNVDSAKLEGLDDDQIRSIGLHIGLGVERYTDNKGNIYINRDNSAALALKLAGIATEKQLKYFSYSEKFELSGELDDIYGHADAGRLMKLSSSIPHAYPLKFSRNKDAIYEKLDASENCPEQGFFYMN